MSFLHQLKNQARALRTQRTKAPCPAAAVGHDTWDELAKRIVAQESRFG
jgi:hypothetical protein